MKKFHTLVLLFVFVCSTPHTLSAQARLGIYYTSASTTTPSLGSQLSVFTQLKNLSSTDTFNGVINFSLANKDSIITNLSVVGYPSFSGTVIKLAPQEQRSALFTVQMLPSYFKVGPDIIIVWPVANAPIVDSARAAIDIQAPLSINYITDDSMLVFVANDQLIIQNRGSEIGLQQVQIFDLMGRTAKSYYSDESHHSISLNGLSHGIYIAEVRENGSITRRLKFTR